MILIKLLPSSCYSVLG